MNGALGRDIGRVNTKVARVAHARAGLQGRHLSDQLGAARHAPATAAALLLAASLNSEAVSR